MTLIAYFDLELHQMDMKTVFLNENIDETNYIVQLENLMYLIIQNLWSQTSISSMES